MYKIFIVNEETWEEHKKASIAAINDPVETHPKNKNSIASRQGAISEMAGIIPGDKILFYVMGTQEIHGVYEATTLSYYDKSPLFKGAKYVTKYLPFRVGFKRIIEFEKPLCMEDIWKAKEEGKIWMIQQSYGDAVSKRGQWSISKPEFEVLVKMMKEMNISYKFHNLKNLKIKNLKSLPIENKLVRSPSSECNADVLNYENALISFLIQDLRNGKHKNIFGDFDDILIKAPTGSRKELDLLLLRYSENSILWFQIIEAKKGMFTLIDIQQLMNYYEWYSQIIKSANLRNVHPVALAYCFNEEVYDYIKNLKKYNLFHPKLIEYRYKNKTLNINDVTP